MRRRSHSKPAEAAAVVPPTKTVAQLRTEVDLLENAIKDRKLLFLDLCEQRGASAAADEDATRVTPPEDPVEEARRLASRNAFLRDELKVLDAVERQYANDPRVRDKRNEVRLVQMQIAQVEREVDTLQKVKKWRDEGLRAIGRTEEQTRRMRGQQHEMNSQLREEVRQRMEELRELEKADMEVHTRFARLQDQVKLSVTDADVQQLRQTLEAQNTEIENLSGKEAAWRKQRASVREEDYRIVAKYNGECAKLAEEEERLHELLRQKELELKRSYFLLKRYGTAPRAPMSGGGNDEVGDLLPSP
ncbi:hypothetical protein CGC20_13615 [Leishmania donovani]|uniref:Uncharacterized protein n=3 Tax=Leishmania donovani species complex TaxID=38574 RepID=A4I3G7_LEIIN|nr:conserved hypothetical protein [Leishmania infantum JPCM5]XP_003862198.1 hypothetical protein, conserved [Leishmania donovani]CAC9502613.1 hypothetical_protein_-_conserved [Leishmania infantum]AYU80249.1 hypothetical protein LdCL_280014500 [Leishmania donovani]TPP40538.1 hypothetical protein CGC20_13615 [Leishmania donovani]TPP54239.1 hypothetical protein CGC21_21990 [Leishmania donovani]CAM69321.1 conserved hypothetical protein [Leishmania infantum JPCM5]|eukprot:XP_001470129.1 conserved hypothetical protein [Leishmania infantum JPCM5]